MRITTSFPIFLFLFVFLCFDTTAQEVNSYIPSPFNELMQKLSSSGTIEGLIYADFNGNGTRDTDEPGLDEVRVIVVNANGNGQTTLTNSDGIWSTQVVEGNANILIDFNSLPSGFLQTEGTDPSSVLVNADVTVQAEIKGYTFQGEASGHLYFDSNGNGVQDSLELDMPDIDILITDQYGNSQTISTNVEGDWSATALFGDIEVKVYEQDNDFPTGAFQTEGANPSTHNIPQGLETFTENDGFFESGILSGVLYFDDDASGNQDPEEQGISNIPVEITTSQGVIINLTTDGNGNWSTRVPNGITESLIDETNPNFPIGASQTEGDNRTTTEVINGETYQEFDGFFVSDPNLTGLLIGHLYFDDNSNGTQDVGEPDMPNVNVDIIDTFDNIFSLTTDANGDWEIEVHAGRTRSNINQNDPDFPTGAIQTEGTNPSETFVIANGNTFEGDNGFFVQDPSLTGTLLGHLYFDNNSNGVQDNDEPEMPNVTVEILDSDGVIQSVVTDANGDWKTTVADDEVTSTIDTTDPDFPKGATQTQGTNPTTTIINAGQEIPEDPDGFFTPNQTGTLSGVLYEDLNGNGIQDEDEIGIEGVEVEILESDGETSIVTTNAYGQWSVPIIIGETTSTINNNSSNFPVGAIQTQGTNPTTTFVASNSNITEVPDGFFVEEITGILIGRLYYDVNGNKTQDANEDGIPNVSILIDDVDSNEFEVETNSYGDWSIKVLAGETISKIDTDDINFPANVSQTEGTDPTTTLNVAGEINNSGNDGFFIDDIEIFNAIGSEVNQINSFFYIKGIENYSENSVQIFNRQGVKVYDAEGYDNGEVRFDGFSKGNITIQKNKRLPTGTYFYILNYVNRNGEPTTMNGYLHLN